MEQQDRKSKIFRVNYQTEHGKGGIMIYVDDFFGKNRLNDAKPFLRFARTHCTREQQLALLAELKNVKEEKLKQRVIDCIYIERIEKTIQKIEAQIWGESTTKKRKRSSKKRNGEQQ